MIPHAPYTINITVHADKSATVTLTAQGAFTRQTCPPATAKQLGNFVSTIVQNYQTGQYRLKGVQA
jgi:hypothetical protein